MISKYVYVNAGLNQMSKHLAGYDQYICPKKKKVKGE